MRPMWQHSFTGTIVFDAGNQVPFMRLPRTTKDETTHRQTS
jgi:hypothetical protein